MKTDFKHIHIQGDPARPALLLLHGTGGDEHDLVELAQSVSPGSTILSLRGKVLEHGMPRFFRRFAEGVFDLDDLKFRTVELADFIEDAKREYGITEPLYALGFSNGANIAASLILSKPDMLDGAVLIRTMVPFEPEALPDLSGKKILMLSGLMDQIIPVDNAKHLAWMFKQSNADISFTMKPAGHGLTQTDISDITNWLKAV